MFRCTYVTWFLCSQVSSQVFCSPMFYDMYVPLYQCSQVPLFPSIYVPRYLCLPASKYPRTNVLQYHCNSVHFIDLGWYVSLTKVIWFTWLGHTAQPSPLIWCRFWYLQVIIWMFNEIHLLKNITKICWVVGGRSSWTPSLLEHVSQFTALKSKPESYKTLSQDPLLR